MRFGNARKVHWTMEGGHIASGFGRRDIPNLEGGPRHFPQDNASHKKRAIRSVTHSGGIGDVSGNLSRINLAWMNLKHRRVSRATAALGRRFPERQKRFRCSMSLILLLNLEQMNMRCLTDQGGCFVSRSLAGRVQGGARTVSDERTLSNADDDNRAGQLL